MNARKVEFWHNTPEQTEEFIVKALALVARLDPPEDLRPAVFQQACALYSARIINFEQMGPLMAIPRNNG